MIDRIGIDCGDVFMSYTYLQTHKIVYIKYVQLFVYSLYLNIAVKMHIWKSTIKQTMKIEGIYIKSLL